MMTIHRAILGLSLSGVAIAAASSLSACTEATSATHLTRDYVLSSTDPAVSNVTNILMRYEDDWLPGTCVGVTRHLAGDATTGDLVRIQWRCKYATNAGPTAGAPIEGTLYDPDGDGTFVGTLIVVALPDVNQRFLSPPAPYTYTMTPYTQSDAGF